MAINDREQMRRILLSSPSKTLSENEHYDVISAIKTRSETTRNIFGTIKERRELQRQTYTLRATRDGVVSGLSYLPGDVVQAGQEIVRTVSEKPERVIGFLPEIALGEIQIGDRLKIVELTRLADEYIAIVQSISPDVQGLPGRISPIRGRTVRGRNVILLLEGEHHLVPGQSVSITSTVGSPLDRIKDVFR